MDRIGHSPEGAEEYSNSAKESDGTIEGKSEKTISIEEKYKDDLEKIEPIGKHLEKEDDGNISAGQEISFDQLVFVRADEYMPSIDKNGNLNVLNATDATGGEIDRMTNHFTLNHLVESNDGGNWDNRDFQFIIPGNEMIEANGDPENLYSVDSFWTKSTVLPEGSVIIVNEEKKTEIPKELNDKYIVIKRDKETNNRELVSAVLDKMGYTEIRGGGSYSNSKNIDSMITHFANKENIRAEVHRSSWSKANEESNFLIKEAHHSEAMSRIIGIYDGTEEADRMPSSLKEKTFKGIFEVFKIQEDQYAELLDDRAKIMENSIIHSGEDETLSDIEQLIEGNKEKISKQLFKILRQWTSEEDIPIEDKALMIKSLPKEGWQYFLDREAKRFKSEVNTDILQNNFLELYANPYKEITGEELKFEPDYAKYSS